MRCVNPLAHSLPEPRDRSPIRNSTGLWTCQWWGSVTVGRVRHREVSTHDMARCCSPIVTGVVVVLCYMCTVTGIHRSSAVRVVRCWYSAVAARCSNLRRSADEYDNVSPTNRPRPALTGCRCLQTHRRTHRRPLFFPFFFLGQKTNSLLSHPLFFSRMPARCRLPTISLSVASSGVTSHLSRLLLDRVANV